MSYVTNVLCIQRGFASLLTLGFRRTRAGTLGADIASVLQH